MSVYDIDYGTAVRQHTPVRLRKVRRLAWLRTLVAGVVALYDVFIEYRTRTNYYLNHTSQVCYLQAALNDTFDNTLRRIVVGDPVLYDAVYIYLDIEEKPVYLATDAELPVVDYEAPVPLYTDSEIYTMGGVQFVVYYPSGLVFDMNYMKALINKYRLPSKNHYAIVED